MAVHHVAFNTSQVEEIKKLVKENKVVVFSKTYCPFSAEAVALLEEVGVEPVVVQLDRRGDMDDTDPGRTLPIFLALTSAMSCA